MQDQAILIGPTDTAQWHSLVSEAEHAAHLRLDEACESYLVFMLMRFTNRPQLAEAVLGMEFLNQLQQPGAAGREQMRDVGDQCLLYSGLFPNQARRKLVRVSYFVDLGRSAYDHLHLNDRHLSDLYGKLVKAFVPMMDVLQAMRGLGDADQHRIDLLDAFELQQDTGSVHADKVMRAGLSSETPIIRPGDDGVRH